MIDHEKIIDGLREIEQMCIISVPRCPTAVSDIIDSAVELLKAQQPREHGQWVDIPDKPYWDQKMCNICGEYFCCQQNYCPNCGAMMDDYVDVNKEGGAEE